MYVVFSKEGFFSGLTERKFETDFVFSVELDQAIYEKFYQYFEKEGVNVLFEDGKIILEKYTEDGEKIKFPLEEGG